MHNQIAAYLFQNKTCPLPGLGTLSLLNSGAEYDFANKMIAAPKTLIEFTEAETDAAGLVSYLCAANGGNQYQATEALDLFCDDLRSKITLQPEVPFENLGSFSVDVSGKISFRQQILPEVFTQPVFAERVIHPDAEHQILVGDKETTNTVMTELLAPKPETKDRWWIWAIVLGVAGLVAVLIYFTEFKGALPFGNVVKI